MGYEDCWNWLATVGTMVIVSSQLWPGIALLQQWSLTLLLSLIIVLMMRQCARLKRQSVVRLHGAITQTVVYRLQTGHRDSQKPHKFYNPPSQNVSPRRWVLSENFGLNVCFWTVLETGIRPRVRQWYQAERNGCALSPTSVRSVASTQRFPQTSEWVTDPLLSELDSITRHTDSETRLKKHSIKCRFDTTSHHHLRKSRNVCSFISRILMRLAHVALRRKIYLGLSNI